MSSNTRSTGTTRTTVASLEKRFNAFTEAQTEHNQQVLDLLTALKPGTAKAAVKGKTTKVTKPATTKASKGKKAKSGLTFKEQQVALKALKVKGEAPAGMTVRQAIEAGLLGATFTPERAPKVEAKTSGKGKSKAKATEGTPFPVLKAALKAHKASGAIPAQHNGTYVSVRSAIEDGLMNADGSLPGTKAKAPKAKAKGAQVVAVTSDATPAYEAPRRADGTITPKREWVLREQLAETGRFDRHQIDRKVAKAVAKGLI